MFMDFEKMGGKKEKKWLVCGTNTLVFSSIQQDKTWPQIDLAAHKMKGTIMW